MVTKVKATDDYWLLANSDHIIRRLVRDALVAFSIEKLRELKLVTGNFKNGYDFSDGYYIRYDLKKFYKLIIGALYKAISFLSLQTGNFIEVSNGSRPRLRVLCTYDLATYRYVRRIATKFRELNLLYELEIVNMYEQQDYMYVDFVCNADRTNVCMQTYKLLMLVPQALTFLKTLSRKARFTNEQFRTYNRSGKIGYRARPAA